MLKRADAPSIYKRKRRLKGLINNWQLYCMLLLPIIYYVLMKYMPMYGTLIAFKKV